MRGATSVTLQLTKYRACHTEWLACLIVVTYETSFTMRGATGVTIQPYQILRLPHRMTRMLDRRHIWNVIYNARSNRCHHPTSPNTAPATQNDSTALSSSHMKRHFQCAEQQVSRFNLSKYCACHEKWHCKISEKISKNNQKQVKRHFQCGDDPRMIRPWSDHENANRNPPRKWGYFSSSPGAFSIEKYNVSRPILHSNIHQILRLPRKVTLELHQIVRLSRRKTHILSPHRIWNVIYSARSNRCHEPTSPNTAPATKNDSTALSSSHMKRHFQCAEQQVSLSNLPKYCACHEKWHCKMSKKISKNRWNVISNAGPIRPWSENDPSMIREWSENENANRNPPRKWGYFARSPEAFSIVKYNVSRPILHSNLHQILRLPPKVPLELYQILRLPRKSDTWTSPSSAPATKSDTWTSPPNTAPATKNDSTALSSSHMKRHFQCAEQQVSLSNLPKYCTCHEKWHCKMSKKISKNRWNVISNAGPIRPWSENDPSMIREWSEHENANRNPPRKWGYFSSSPRAFSIEKYNVSRPILHSNLHQILRLPPKVPLELYQILRLPRKVTLELHQVVRLPRKVTLELHQVLRLPRKVTLELHQVLHPTWPTLLDSTLLDTSLLDSTLLDTSLLDLLYLDSTLLDSTLLDTSLLDLLYLTLLYLTLLYLTLLYLTLFYLTLLYLDSTLLDTILLDSTLLDSTLLDLLYLTLLYWTLLYLLLFYLDSTLLDLLYLILLYLTLLYLDTILLDSTLLASILLDSTLLDLLYLILLYLTLVYLTYSTWLYSTWLYSTWLYSTWHYSTWLYSTWLYSTWLYSTWLYSTWHYSTWLYSTWHYSTWLYSTCFYSTWLYSTWLYSIWPTLLDSTLLGLYSTWTLLYLTLLYLTLLYLTLLYLTLLYLTLLYLT